MTTETEKADSLPSPDVATAIATAGEIIDRSERLQHEGNQDNLLGVRTVSEAIGLWLKNYEDSQRTHDAYYREAFRLALWAALDDKDLAKLTLNDVNEFITFLKDPEQTGKQPERAGKLCGPRVHRGHENWKPFYQPLTDAGVRYALIVLGTFYTWLNNAKFVDGNPFALVRGQRRKPIDTDKDKRLVESKLIEAVWDYLDRGDPGVKPSTFARRRWVFALFSMTGMRISEPKMNSMGSFQFSYDLETKGLPPWSLRIMGKGKKTRVIPAPPRLIQELRRYREAMGLTPLPLHKKQEDDIPLIQVSPTNIKPMAKATLDKDIHGVFKAASIGLEPQAAQDLQDASMHWLRHSYATTLLEKGLSLHAAQEVLGHSSLATLGIYSHGDREEKAGIAAKF